MENHKVYIGYDDKQTYTGDEPLLLEATIDKDFDRCLTKTGHVLAQQGVITTDDAENMDIDLADALGIHVLGIDSKIIQALADFDKIKA